jgi:CheY-like chemotaxis protein
MMPSAIEDTNPWAIVVGSHEFREFQLPLLQLRRRMTVVEFSTAASAHDWLARRASRPTVIVFAQAYPGQLAVGDVERLHALSPVSRLIALLGSWCEGEPRSGNPWPGVPRVYWHRWSSRITTALWADPAGAWSLPRTATQQERLLADIDHLPGTRRGLVAVATRSAETFHALSDALVDLGFSTTWLRVDCLTSVEQPLIVLWDGDIHQETDLSFLRQIATSTGPAPTIALLNFPRWDEVQLAIQCGAVAVVSKPFQLSDLFSAIDDWLPAAARSADAA